MNIKAIIEMPKGTSYKYEVNKEKGTLRVDRQLNRCIPYNYGFVPDTMCSDGDPLDIFVLSDEPINPLTEVEVTILGVFECTDNGVSDNKLVSVLVGDPRASRIDKDLEFIAYYLNHYKEGFVVNGFKLGALADQDYHMSRVWPNPAD